MTRKQRVRKLAFTIAITLGIVSGLLGLCIARNGSLQKDSIALSLLLSLLYFGTAFGAVIGIYKILTWVALGFYRDLQADPPPTYRIINLKRGARRAVLVLAAVSAVCSALFACSIPFGEYVIAQDDLKTLQNQGKDYQGKAYYDYMQRLRLEDNYWLNLRREHLVAICILFSLAGGAFGFCAIWFGYKLIEQQTSRVRTEGGQR